MRAWTRIRLIEFHCQVPRSRRYRRLRTFFAFLGRFCFCDPTIIGCPIHGTASPWHGWESTNPKQPVPMQAQLGCCRDDPLFWGSCNSPVPGAPSMTQPHRGMGGKARTPYSQSQYKRGSIAAELILSIGLAQLTTRCYRSLGQRSLTRARVGEALKLLCGSLELRNGKLHKYQFGNRDVRNSPSNSRGLNERLPTEVESR